jgi:hypothetical protein
MLDDIKTELTGLIGLSRDALHVHLGLLVFLVAMVVFRRSPGSIIPWGCVLVLELVNEFLDAFHIHRGSVEFFADLGAVRDVVNTMLWPTIVLLLSRVGPKASALQR